MLMPQVSGAIALFIRGSSVDTTAVAPMQIQSGEMGIIIIVSEVFVSIPAGEV